MPKKPSKPKDVLEEMHDELAQALLKRVRDGSATASDLNVARQFLRDNNYEANQRNHKPLRELADEVPFADTGT